MMYFIIGGLVLWGIVLSRIMYLARVRRRYGDFILSLANRKTKLGYGVKAVLCNTLTPFELDLVELETKSKYEQHLLDVEIYKIRKTLNAVILKHSN